MASTASSAPGLESDHRLHPDSNAATETTALLNRDSVDDNAVRDDGEGTSPAWAGDDDFSHLPKWRRPSVYWLVGPYVLFTLAFGGSIVPKVNLIVELVCRQYFADRSTKDPSFVFAPVIPGGDNPQCRQTPAVQRNVATFNMALNLITGALSALTVPKIGSLSDRYGRKRLMVVASCGGILGETIIILAAKYPDVVHYNWLILGAVADGLAGSFTAGGVVTNSYTADCTPPSKRAIAIGYLHACLYVGLALGPVMAGYMVEKWTHELVSVFYVTLACHIFFVLFILAFVPESVSRKRQLTAREKHAELAAEAAAHRRTAGNASNGGLGARLSAAVSRGTNPLAPLRALWPPRLAGSGPELRRNLVFLAVIDTTLLAAVMGASQVIILYSELQFGWTNFETSNFVSLTSVVRVFVLLGIFPLVNRVFRRARPTTAVSEKNAGADELDLWVLRAALASDVLGVAGYVFARVPALFVASGVVTALGGLGTATTQTALSKHVPPERVGALLGAIGLLHSLARVLAPLAISGIYAATVDFYPQSPFVLLLAMFGSILTLAFFVRPHVYLKDDADETWPPSARECERDDLISDEEILPAQ